MAASSSSGVGGGFTPPDLQPNIDRFSSIDLKKTGIGPGDRAEWDSTNEVWIKSYPRDSLGSRFKGRISRTFRGQSTSRNVNDLIKQMTETEQKVDSYKEAMENKLLSNEELHGLFSQLTQLNTAIGTFHTALDAIQYSYGDNSNDQQLITGSMGRLKSIQGRIQELIDQIPDDVK